MARSPQRVVALRPRIETIVDGLLEDAARKRDSDMIRDLAYPLPVIVIAERRGVPAEDHAMVQAWSDAFTSPTVPHEWKRSMGLHGPLALPLGLS